MRNAGLAASIENLAATYNELAMAMPGTSIRRWDTGMVCNNELPFAVCNFGVVWGDFEEARRPLQSFLRKGSSFPLYVVPGDWTPTDRRKVEDAGFRYAHTLHLLESRGLDPEKPFLLTLADGVEGRTEVARFMVSVFFNNHPADKRERLCQATSGAKSCELYSLTDASTKVAAVMLMHTPLAVGLYNLCVHPDCRGIGIGSSVVRQIQTKAVQAGLPVTLQCHSSLASWYKGLGFYEVGTMDVFAVR